MLEDIVKTGIWRQIKQLSIEFHFFQSHMNFFRRHAHAISNFLEKTSFIQVKHDIFPGAKIDLGAEFDDTYYCVAIVHFVNKNFFYNWFLRLFL